MKEKLKDRPRSKHILLMEDDHDIGVAMAEWLQQAGFSVWLCESGKAFLKKIKDDTFALYILDWGMPDISGLDVLQSLRTRLADNTPVIFVTARKMEVDIASALDEGADDYIVKPFSQAILLARVQAVLRRAEIESPTQLELDVPPFVLKRETSELTQDGAVIDLTEKEFKLAWMLLAALGTILPRGRLIETIWGPSTPTDTRTLDTHIYRLRQKLNLSPENGFRLVTVHKLGYRLEKLNP